MNPKLTDLSSPHELVRTVEDPASSINRQISHWIRERDLVIRGVNIASGLQRVQSPLLCIVANRDGIVPRNTARYAYDHIGSRKKRLLEVGSDDQPHAHADLFVSTGAETRVFEPIAAWLAEHA